jgi:hypothetical protein
MRLREAAFAESTRADILWHSHAGQRTTRSRRSSRFETLEKVTDEKHANNVSLDSIMRGESPDQSPHRNNTARSGAGFRPLMLQ